MTGYLLQNTITITSAQSFYIIMSDGKVSVVGTGRCDNGSNVTIASPNIAGVLSSKASFALRQLDLWQFRWSFQIQYSLKHSNVHGNGGHHLSLWSFELDALRFIACHSLFHMHILRARTYPLDIQSCNSWVWIPERYSNGILVLGTALTSAPWHTFLKHARVIYS